MSLSAECVADTTLVPPAGPLEGDFGMGTDLGDIDTLLGSSELDIILDRTS